MRYPLLIVLLPFICMLAGCGGRDQPASELLTYRSVVIREAPDAERAQLEKGLADAGFTVVPASTDFLKSKNDQSRATSVCTLASSTGQYLSEETLTLTDYLTDGHLYRKTKGSGNDKQEGIIGFLLADLKRVRQPPSEDAKGLDAQRRQLGSMPGSESMTSGPSGKSGRR